jgi:NAD(P)H-quinone oxidoreductase subunit I
VAELKFERYGLGIAKGMALTLKHLFRRPLTVQYPEEKLVTSRRIRGIELVWYPSRCKGCNVCSQNCPHGNIEIITRKGDDKKRVVEKFEVDAGRCMFCGLCVESCPYHALAMGTGYEKAEFERVKLFENKEKLALSDTRQPSGYARPKVEATLPKQTLLINWDRKRKDGGQKLSWLGLSKKRGRGV